MPGTTPVYGFPYPEPTDLVADYPALGQDLAEDIETVLQTLSGLAKISTTAVGSGVSTISVSNCFSATYTNYRIVISELTGSTTNQLRMKFAGLTGSNYNSREWNVTSTTGTAAGDTSATQWVIGYMDTGSANAVSVDVYAPAVTGNRIGFTSLSNGRDRVQIFAGQYAANGDTTGFTIDTNTGTFSGGEIRVYGYKD